MNNMFFTTKDYTDVKNLDEKDLICFCLEVDKGTIVKAIRNGAVTIKSIRETTTACTGNECKKLNPTQKCCSPQINKLIKIYQG